MMGTAYRIEVNQFCLYLQSLCLSSTRNGSRGHPSLKARKIPAVWLRTPALREVWRLRRILSALSVSARMMMISRGLRRGLGLAAGVRRGSAAPSGRRRLVGGKLGPPTADGRASGSGCTLTSGSPDHRPVYR